MKPSYKDRYRQVRWDRQVEIKVQGYLPYPNRYAVSPKRAEEIKAEWRRLAAEAKPCP